MVERGTMGELGDIGSRLREEREAARNFLARHPGKPAEAVADLCHAVLNLNEFLFLD